MPITHSTLPHIICKSDLTFDGHMLDAIPQYTITIPHGTLTYIPCYFHNTQALYYTLAHTVNWTKDEILLFGTYHKIPRMQAWYGDVSYTYSRITLPPQAWTRELFMIKSIIEHVAHTHFNSVLLNWYQNGKDHMGWHSDNEPELGNNPIIASVSFGATRDFILRNKAKPKQKLILPLENGSILIMNKNIQHYYEHSLPKRLRCQAPRINLTYRMVYS